MSTKKVVDTKKASPNTRANIAIPTADNANYIAEIESSKFATAYKELIERVLPDINIRKPETFATYGSAERYYQDSFSYIYNSYPYDGSRLEKVNWSLSASAVDLGVLQHEYPRETGFVNFSPSGWGSVSASSGRYGLSTTPEYIKFSGGPYVGSVYSLSSNRESSLKVNPSDGNTLEFWLKKDSFVSGSTGSEVVFDSYTIDFAEGEDRHGRFLLELSGATGSPFHLTYMSGTTGFDRIQVGEDITTATVADGNWHHYAFVVSYQDSILKAETYLDGQYNSTVTSSIASMGAVSGYFNGVIGSLATEKDSNGGLGYGKLSGSLDEIRFWKTARTAKSIGNHFDFPVHGATDNESIDSVLGIYYKFNEGTISSQNTDKVILDYSGRLNNGEFIGYTTASRGSGSAITESDSTTQKELGDPIMNPQSSRVKSSLDFLVKIGKDYDKINNSLIFKTVPQWVFDSDFGSSNYSSDFGILLQTIASKFDSIKILIDGLPRLGRTGYTAATSATGSVNYTESFYSVLCCSRELLDEQTIVGSQGQISYQNLLSRGFNVEELPIVNKVGLGEYIDNLGLNQAELNSENGSHLVESKMEIIKNKILQNTYNNLHSIYETKGTESSFRNLIRCFGVDEKLVAPNVYINNGEIILKDDLVQEEVRVKSLALKDDNRKITLFQTSSASDERYYIVGKDSGSVSYEIKTLLPSIDNATTVAATSSIFGINEVETSSFEVSDPNNAGFVVKSVKSRISNKGTYFTLSSSAGIFNKITTEYFAEAFNDTIWNLSVRFSEDTDIKFSNVNNKSTKQYKVEFSGHQYEQDILVSDFNLSESISQSDYDSFIQANKSVFIGAERTGITGSLITESENKFLSFSVWDDYLDYDEIREHAKSSDNLGRFLAFQEESDNRGRSYLRSDSLVLNWQFDDVSINNSVAQIEDHASGSTQNVSIYGPIVGYKYPAKSTAISNSNEIVGNEILSFMKQVQIDNARAKSRVEIKEREIDSFELDSRPISYMYTYEKSMYQVISREMLRMIAGVSAYNNLVGEPIYKYRQDYKSLEKLRERFFNKVESDIDLERFIEYYKWFDSSLGKMLQQLQPATAAMKLGLQDVVESHAFERNKYKHQAPTFEFKDPKIEGQILGINELLYDWEHGHAPLLVEEPIYWAAFDGTDDFIDVPDHDDHNFGDSLTDEPFSLSAWVVFTDPSVNQAIMGKFEGNADSEYLLFTNGGYLQFNIYDEDTGSAVRIQSVTNSMPFTAGTLYNITVTYDGSGLGTGINIYIDGTLVAQTRTTGGSYTAMHNTSVNFQIGSTVLGTLDFARNMRHVMVFGAELASSDVTELLSLYDRGKLDVSATTLTKYSDLISWWKLDGTDLGSATATDAIGGHDGTFNGDAEIVLEGNFIFSERNQAENCLWWKDRAERDDILAITGGPNDDRQTINTRINTVVSGSTYVVRNLSRPYKIEGQNVKTIQVGSNRNANKNKDLYRIVNSGKEITLDAVDIYEFKQCDDVIDPQEEKVYTAKADVEGTSGYLDVDADMIFPFSLYSSSAGNDFSIFKDNLKITNNHDDEAFSLQGPFVREFVGGMPHRRVKFLTADTERAEAYILSASATTLTLKQSSGLKSMVSRGRSTFLNIANIKTDKDSTPIVLGNYDKVYEIVQTHGRSLNNRLLADSGSIPIDPISTGRVFGTVDYTVPTRPRSEHVFVNRFSAPGGPETMAHGSRDLESGEFSIYNTMNYRNLSVRDPLNRLHSERSEQFGYRSGSTTQASVHMTNRNYLYSVTSGSYGEEKEPDNFYAQHPIPQNDMQYAWITASSDTTALELVDANAGFGHQHGFTTGSKSAIQFISSSTYQNPLLETLLEASDAQSSDYFGTSVSLYGDTAVVGAPGEDDPGSQSGAIYLYKKTNGYWTQTDKIEASDAANNDNFGYSVSLYKDVMVVGAYLNDTYGKAYIYEKNNDSWEEKQIISSSVSSLFDYSKTVAVYGQGHARDADVFVADPYYSTSKGSVLVYRKQPNGSWSESQRISPSDLTNYTYFGRYGISVHGETLVVGSEWSDPGGITNAGGVYIFDKLNDNSWPTSSYTQFLTASDKATQDDLGHDVAIYGSAIVAAAPGKDSAAGAAYIYEKTAGTWAEVQKLQPSELVATDRFGDAVAIGDGVVAVGAAGQGTPALVPGSGSVYIYEKQGDSWVQVNKLMPPQGTPDFAAYSWSLSFDGDVLLVGAKEDNSTTANYTGVAYTYRKMGKSWADVEANYAGINLNIVDGLDESTNTLQKATDATVSQLITHRQGPYAWPTWKQIRGYEHPIARAHKNSNTFSRVYMGSSQVNDSLNKKALLFEGTNSYLNIDSTVNSFVSKKGVSVFAWIKHPEVTNLYSHALLGIHQSDGNNRIVFGLKGTSSDSYTGPGTLTFYQQTAGTRWNKGSHTRIDDNQWHHVGFVFNKTSDTSATIDFYLDGVKLGSTVTGLNPLDAQLNVATDKVSIGQEFDFGLSTSDFWGGYIADFAIWNRSLSSTEVSDLVKYSGVDSRSFGPINLNKHSAANNLTAWYKMGDGKLNNRSDTINIELGDTTGNRIFNNADIFTGQYDALPTGSSETFSIVDVSRELPGDYFVSSPKQIISGSHDIAMNAGYSRALDRSANVYERARKLDVLGTDNLGTFDKIRVIKNYKDIPVTKRFFPMSLTFHGSEAPTRGTWYTEEEMVWKEGLDSRLPRFFKVRENIQKLDQSTREMAWINDSNYYEYLTKNIILGEDFEIEELSDYASSYGHVGLKKTYQNDVTTFSEMQIMEDAFMSEDVNHEYLPFVNSLVDELATNDSKLLQSSYSEKIYPREINTFTKNARERENFDFFRWKSSVSDRSIILSGNVNHYPDQPLLAEANASAFPKYDSSNQDDYKKSFFGLFDAVDVSSNSGGNIEVASNISASSWVLDSRSDLTVYPVNITSSYLNDSSSFLAARDQGTRGEGILQNDFSTFPLGYNGLYGAPPFSLVYNRRIPQVSGSDVYLAGEAKWEASTGTLGPFYDSYKDYAFSDIRLMAQDHSIVPEFRISEFVNEILAGDRPYPDGRIEDPLSYWEDYLSITGAVYANSSGDIELGPQFYKSYSNSDFMKYFEVIDNNVISNEQPISHSRITLKCKAAMKFLPYKGFYPADRATEIAELFYKNYLSDNVLAAARVFDDSQNSEEDTRQYLKLRAHCSRYQASKLLFGPGVLMNSIKAGVAVDYPRFSGAIANVRDRLPETIPLTGSWPTAEDEIFIASGSFFTGSAINNTVDQGIPRLKGPGVKPGARIEFEDMLNPANIYDTTLYDHEPHPSASLIYGSKYWNRIIERSAKFGNFNQNLLPLDLGIEFNNTRESFARQMSPYTMAMQNFAAETVNFFVEDGHLTTAMSKPIDEYFVSGTTYKMNVRLTNVDNVMYDRHSAFGPPVDDSGDGLELRDLSVAGAPAPDAIALTFNDPDDYRAEIEASVHSQGDLPGFLIKDMDSQGNTLTPFFDVVFYSSDTQKSIYPDYSSSGYVLIYIDIDDLTTANDVAQEVKSRLQSFSLITQYLDVSSDGSIITMSASYNGPSEISTSLTQNGTIGIDIFTGSSNPSIFASTVSAFTFSGGVAEDADYYTESTIATTSSHGYMPFVPPFLDPNADPYVEVSFTPDESRNWSAREIVEASTFEYYNFKEVPNNSDSNNNYIHAMSLSASLNLGIITSLKTDNVETIVSGNGFISNSENPEVIGVQTDIKVDDNKKLDRWVIQTKWETPVLDFTNVKATALNLSTGQEQLVSGSPWKTRYWDQYYSVGKPRSGVTSGSFMTGSIGMWHQKGALIGNDSLTKDKGYFLKIEDVQGSEGLASKLGFVNYAENQQSTKGLKRAKEYRTRIGAVEDRKVVKEAVVAIPYVIRKDLNNRVDFVTFNPSLFEHAKNNFNFIKKELNNVPLSSNIATIEEYKEFLAKYQKQTRDYISDAPLNAIEYQLFMMEDYILPPQLDFRITGNDPFMMYFFQFRASLDKTDVSNIWQNLYPESYLSSAKGRYSCADRSFEGRIASMKDVSYVSHYLDTLNVVGNNLSPVDSVYDLFSPRNTQDKTRWLVFKVKERGQANLENIRMSSIDPRISNVEKLEYIKESKSSLTTETQNKVAETSGLRSAVENKLQYNWPYDYFSFVELVKLEAKIDSYNYKK